MLVLSMHRAGSEDVRGSGGSGLRGDQHRGGPAEGPRRENRQPAAARLRPRPVCSDSARHRRENGSRVCSKPGLHQPEDHHPAQRNTRSHRVPHLRHQTKNLEPRVPLFSTVNRRFIIRTLCLAPVYFTCTLIRL